MKSTLMISVLILVAMSGMAAADLQTGWPMDKPNEYSGPHVMVDFEDNMSSYELIIPQHPDIEFLPYDAYQWMYGSKDGKVNIYPTGPYHQGYIVNGYSGAWCGEHGNAGKIAFAHDVRHVSLLVSTSGNVEIEAYNRNGDFLVTSGTSGYNLFTLTFDRLSVYRCESDIAYVVIHDSGNYWACDDVIVGTSYEPVCTEIAISTNGSDVEVCFGMTINFTAECTDQYGLDMDCPGLNWTSNDTRVGTMDGSVFTADKKGNTTIEASFGDDVTSNPIDITVVPGQKMLAHCQKFIHGQGDEHWNDSAWMNKPHPCNYTV